MNKQAKNPSAPLGTHSAAAASCLMDTFTGTPNMVSEKAKNKPQGWHNKNTLIVKPFVTLVHSRLRMEKLWLHDYLIQKLGLFGSLSLVMLTSMLQF